MPAMPFLAFVRSVWLRVGIMREHCTGADHAGPSLALARDNPTTSPDRPGCPTIAHRAPGRVTIPPAGIGRPGAFHPRKPTIASHLSDIPTFAESAVSLTQTSGFYLCGIIVGTSFADASWRAVRDYHHRDRAQRGSDAGRHILVPCAALGPGHRGGYRPWRSDLYINHQRGR